MRKYSCWDCEHFIERYYTDPWGFTEDNHKCDLHEWNLDNPRKTTCDDNTEDKARNGANFRKVEGKMKQKAIDYDGYYVPYFGEEIQKEIDSGWSVKSTFTKTYTNYDGRHGEAIVYTVVTVIYEMSNE